CGASLDAAADNLTDRATVTVTVNPSSRHPISPYIYGINNAASVEGLPPALTFDRGGGNRLTAYNWETNASNAGRYWQYQNDKGGSEGQEPGAAALGLISRDRKNGMASMVTVQMQGLVAGDTKGPVDVSNPPDKTRFKQVVHEKKTVSNEPFTVK